MDGPGTCSSATFSSHSKCANSCSPSELYRCSLSRWSNLCHRRRKAGWPCYRKACPSYLCTRGSLSGRRTDRLSGKFPPFVWENRFLKATSKKPYLEFVLKFIGFTDLHSILVEGQSLPSVGPQNVEKALEEARALAESWPVTKEKN